MGDTNNAEMAETQNPRDVFADLFTETYPNIAWTIRRSPPYPKTFEPSKAYLTLIDYTNEFLNNIEAGLQCMYNTNTANEKANENLSALIASQTGTINSQAETITVLKQSTPTTTVVTQQKKRRSKDPPIFSGKGTPLERQANFETWHIKIKGVFDRDWDYFDTVQSQILYISDMLEDKAYEFIKQGLELMHENPNNTSAWKWPTKEDMLKDLTAHYEVLDTTQVAKNKLDHFPQGERNYWSWKGELNELMVRAKKTDEQKVDLLRKFISPKMEDLVLGLAHEINDNDYTGWSKQMDVFAKNLANHAHRANLKKNANHRLPAQAPAPMSTPTPAVTREPIDLDGISDTERKRRFDNRLCLACGLPGHWKDAHDPAKTANPVPMPPRQTTRTNNRGRGDRGVHYGRGDRGAYYGRGGRPPPFNPTAQLLQTMPYMGAQPVNNAQY
jgi:hypothetical protein